MMPDEKKELFPVGDKPAGQQTSNVQPPRNEPVDQNRLQTMMAPRVSAGEPTASANARRGMEKGMTNRATLLSVQSRPMPVTERSAFEMEGIEDENGQKWHYHWFGNDPMRLFRAEQLGYEYVKNSDGEKMEMAGQVAMRTPLNDFLARKDVLNKQINPQFERAPREGFAGTGEAAGVDTEDRSRTKRAPFSTIAGEPIRGEVKDASGNIVPDAKITTSISKED
jgi:hypothetical protein